MAVQKSQRSKSKRKIRLNQVVLYTNLKQKKILNGLCTINNILLTINKPRIKKTPAFFSVKNHLKSKFTNNKNTSFKLI